jgi:hypothetical protein
MRTTVGSVAQLPMYEAAKRFGRSTFGADEKDVRLHAFSAMCAALNICLFMCPLDTLTVRMWTSDASKYSPSLGQALKLIVQKEGVLGLWKGVGPLFLRTAPHSLLTFVILEHLRKNRDTTSMVVPFLFDDI